MNTVVTLCCLVTVFPAFAVTPQDKMGKKVHQRLEKQFNMIDTNNDNQLSFAEFKAYKEKQYSRRRTAQNDPVSR